MQKKLRKKKVRKRKKLPEAIRKKIRTKIKDKKLPAGKYTSILLKRWRLKNCIKQRTGKNISYFHRKQDLQSHQKNL